MKPKRQLQRFGGLGRLSRNNLLITFHLSGSSEEQGGDDRELGKEGISFSFVSFKSLFPNSKNLSPFR